MEKKRLSCPICTAIHEIQTMNMFVYKCKSCGQWSMIKEWKKAPDVAQEIYRLMVADDEQRKIFIIEMDDPTTLGNQINKAVKKEWGFCVFSRYTDQEQWEKETYFVSSEYDKDDVLDNRFKQGYPIEYLDMKLEDA